MKLGDTKDQKSEIVLASRADPENDGSNKAIGEDGAPVHMNFSVATY